MKEDKLYILHGYWNLEDRDGVAVVSVSPDFEKVRQKLTKIAETKASEFVSFPYSMEVMEQTERVYEIQDHVMAGTYAKFYITEEKVQRTSNQEYEYGAFIWDTSHNKYVRLGRCVGTELLCRGRMQESIDKEWIMETMDSTRTKIMKRIVETSVGEWEELENEH